MSKALKKKGNFFWVGKKEGMDLQCIFEACGYEKAGENHDALGISRAAAALELLCSSSSHQHRRRALCPFPGDYT